MNNKNYIQTIKLIKSEILKSRYQIAKIANKELLLLYFKVGKMISEKVASENGEAKLFKNFLPICRMNYTDLGDFHTEVYEKCVCFMTNGYLFLKYLKRKTNFVR